MRAAATGLALLRLTSRGDDRTGWVDDPGTPRSASSTSERCSATSDEPPDGRHRRAGRLALRVPDRLFVSRRATSEHGLLLRERHAGSVRPVPTGDRLLRVHLALAERARERCVRGRRGLWSPKSGCTRPDTNWSPGPTDGTPLVGPVDIRFLSSLAGGHSLTLELRAMSPRAWAHDRARRTLEYGVVVDGDGDRVADCSLAHDTGPGTVAVREIRQYWKELRTGATNEGATPTSPSPWATTSRSRTNPPPIRSPSSGSARTTRRLPAPCRTPQGREFHWYAYAFLTEEGRVTAWDYAPDAAWLKASH